MQRLEFHLPAPSPTGFRERIEQPAQPVLQVGFVEVLRFHLGQACRQPRHDGQMCRGDRDARGRRCERRGHEDVAWWSPRLSGLLLQRGEAGRVTAE